MGNALEKQHKSKIARYYAKMIKKLNQLIFQRKIIIRAKTSLAMHLNLFKILKIQILIIVFL